MLVLVARQELWGLFASRTGIQLFPVGYTVDNVDSATPAGASAKQTD